MARAYLAHLKRANFRVRRIIHMIPRPGSLTKFLAPGFRSAMSAAKQHNAAHFWPAKLAQTFPGLYRNMTENIGEAFGLDNDFFKEIRRKDDLEKYASSVTRIEVGSLKDPHLIKALSKEETKDILFTGGGILPNALFAIPGLRLFHVHPGHLPDVRGADGLLWSMLVRGKPGASCFVMAPGLDEGDFIDVRDFSPLTFAIPSNETPDKKSLYRMLFSYYDPVLRADIFTNVIKRFDNLSTISGSPQNLETGVTYHFMEERLRDLAMQKLFKRG